MSVATLNHQATSPRRFGKRLLAHVAILALGLLMIYPPLWMLSSSFKPAQLIFSEPGLWPRAITLDNWAHGRVGLGIPFSRFFLNSAVIAGLSMVGNLFSCSIAAYAFARLEFRFKPMLFALAVTAVFTFIWTWNDFLGPLIYLTATDNYTVPIALNAFLDSTGTSNWGGCSPCQFCHRCRYSWSSCSPKSSWSRASRPRGSSRKEGTRKFWGLSDPTLGTTQRHLQA